MTTKIIKNCDVLSFHENKVQILENQDILIQQEKIISIGKIGNKAADGKPDVIDGDGMLAIPGLINTHAHVAMVLFRNLAEDVTPQSWFNDYIWPMESNLSEEDVYWGALLGIAEMIENGVTCVADHYFYMDQVAKAVEESGIRANLVWAVFGHEGEEKLAQTTEFANRWQGAAGGRITTWLGPHAPYTTGPEFLKLCAEKAKDNHLGIHTHVSETKEQVELSLKEHGMTPVRMLKESGVLDVPTILAHCLYPQEDDLDILENSNTGIAQAPKTYLKAGMGLAPVVDFLNRRIPIGLATDGAASNNTMDILEQMRLMAMLTKNQALDPTVMPVEQVLEIAFLSGAKVVQMADQIGNLKVGMRADICLLRQDGLHLTPLANPLAALVYGIRGSDVDTVICNGCVLMRHRELLTLDKLTIRNEVQNRLSRLSKRVPGARIATYPA